MKKTGKFSLMKEKTGQMLHSVGKKAPGEIGEMLEMVNLFYERTEEEIQKLPPCNIIIAGKTGVGKSTLINYIFREELAQTGIGKPVTQNTVLIEKEGFPLHIYDTRGIELGKSGARAARDETVSIIRDCLRSEDESRRIHCVWYCINTESDRIEQDEIDLIHEIADASKRVNIPVILVLTKSYSKRKTERFVQKITTYGLGVSAIHAVVAQPYEVETADGDNVTVPTRGGDELVRGTYDLMEASVRRGFVHAARQALDVKATEARKCVAACVAANFTVGFVPIPFADTPIMVTTEIMMMAKITSIFGLDPDRDLFKAVLAAIGGVAGASVAGNAIMANLFKLIPGVGTVMSGTISASMASILTTALGEAYIQVMILICRNHKEDAFKNKREYNALVEQIKAIFLAELKKKR